MKRFVLVLLLSLALAGCDDGDNGGGQSYTAQPTYPTPIPQGEPFVVDEREEDRLEMNLLDAIMLNNEETARRNPIR
jgi:hypothetical protein